MKLHSYRMSQMLPSSVNWQYQHVNEQMIYSPRSTRYTSSNFPKGLHFHDYYEVLLYVEGDVRYIWESTSFLMERGDLIVIPPSYLHMSRINSDETLYTRHVFYLYPSVFDAYGGESLLDFLHANNGKPFLASLRSAALDRVLPLLEQLNAALTSDSPDDHALAQGLVLQIFHIFNRQARQRSRTDEYFPPSVLNIQHYLDEHFTEVSTVSEVATHFFYSREYVSRLFKRYLNTTVTDYVLKRRISYSQQLISAGVPLIDVGFQAGFGSVSSFIRSFRNVTGMTPSAYRKLTPPRE